MSGSIGLIEGLRERASSVIARFSPTRLRRDLDRRTVASGGLATLGLAGVGGGLAAGNRDPEWLAVVAGSVGVALALYLVGWGLIAVVIAQIAVAATDPETMRLVGLEAGVVAVLIACLLSRGLDRRTVALAVVAASVAGSAVLSAHSIAPLWALAGGVVLAGAGLAGLVHRIGVVTVGDRT